MWDQLLDFLNDNKDALGWLFGSGVALAVLSGIYRLIIWLIKEYRLRKIRTNDYFPFKIILPNSNVAKEILGGADDDPLADRNIPYQQRIQGRNTRRELEELIEDTRWILITGRTGLGKTREAVQLAQSLNNEGWTILYLTREAWLDTPAKLPNNVPERKLLFFLDDLNKKCFSSKAEIRPNANESLTLPIYEPFQIRLQSALEAFDTFCGKSEIRVIATARNEKSSEFDEPSEWEKIGWTKYNDLWEKFNLWELPEPDEIAEQKLLTETAKNADIRINSDELTIFAKKNDGTFRNLVENLASARVEGYVLTSENFRETLKGTWQKRYKRALQKDIKAKVIYDAIEVLKDIKITPTTLSTIQVAAIVAGDTRFKQAISSWTYLFPLKQLIKSENILHPRDGQIEAKGYRVETKNYLPFLYKQIYLGYSDDTPEFSRTIDQLNLGLYRALRISFIPQSLLIPSTQKSFLMNLYCSLTNKDIVLLMLAIRYLRANFEEYSKYLFEKSLEIRSIGLKRDKEFFSLALSIFGVLQIQQEKVEDAVQTLYKAIESSPKWDLPWIFLARAYRKTGQNDSAIQAYQKATQLNPEKSSHWIDLAIIYHSCKQYDSAIQAYQKAIELDPKNASSWRGLGTTYYSQNQYDSAIQAYQKAIELDPKNASPWRSLGTIYRNRKQYESAIQAYQKAIGLDSKFSHLWIELGSIYISMNLKTEAIQALKKAVEISPDESAHWNDLGNVYRQCNEYDNAIQAYIKSLELNDQNTLAMRNLARLYSLQGNNQKALELLTETIKIDANTAANFISLANVLIRLGQISEANKHLEIAGPLLEKEKENEYWQACFAAICGNVENAINFLKIYIEKAHTTIWWIRNTPEFDNIRDNPLFKKLVVSE